jgi:hypothetical protein
MNFATIPIRIEEPVTNKLDRLARFRRTSRNAVIRYALDRFFESEEAQEILDRTEPVEDMPCPEPETNDELPAAMHTEPKHEAPCLECAGRN